MRPASFAALALSAMSLFAGCGVYHRHGLDATRLQQYEDASAPSGRRLPRALEDSILALDPANVTAKDVRDVLAHAPAPRIINIHGGLAIVIKRMVSFSEFLVGMGYPRASLTNPSDGTHSFSCYESSEKIAGVIAWFYEREGLRPMLVGHSQGGVQVVKVLYEFASRSPSRLHVWNPLTWKKEQRSTIIDPLTGEERPVAGLRLPYATSLAAGGIGRLPPNQWLMTFRLRAVPDTVEEFTGFRKAWDLLGGDFVGFGSLNDFSSAGKAVVRNVRLPSGYRHVAIPDTKHLLNDPKIVDWIDRYRPATGPAVRASLDARFDADSRHILWAADVWFSIRKHWVLELQRLVSARRARSHDG